MEGIFLSLHSVLVVCIYNWITAKYYIFPQHEYRYSHENQTSILYATLRRFRTHTIPSTSVFISISVVVSKYICILIPLNLRILSSLLKHKFIHLQQLLQLMSLIWWQAEPMVVKDRPQRRSARRTPKSSVTSSFKIAQEITPHVRDPRPDLYQCHHPMPRTRMHMSHVAHDKSRMSITHCLSSVQELSLKMGMKRTLQRLQTNWKGGHPKRLTAWLRRKILHSRHFHRCIKLGEGRL